MLTPPRIAKLLAVAAAIGITMAIALALPLTGRRAIASSPELSGSTAFTVVKGLTGAWHGATRSGEPIAIEYKAAAHGSTVIETQAPGTDEEMVTVYSVRGPDLVLTHYCPMGEHGNQPHMILDRAASAPDDLRFSFVSLENLDATKDVHVHGGRLLVLDSDHLQREWDVYKDGKHASTLIFLLTRSAVSH